MALSGIQIYKLLPQTNCKECGFPTCLAFAMKLAAKQVELSLCPYVSEASRSQLAESSAPPIRLVQVQGPAGEVKVGNEVVIYRHDKTFYNRPGIFVRVRENFDEKDLRKIEEFKINYVGIDLQVDGYAIEDQSHPPQAFADAVKKVRSVTGRPLILISDDPVTLDAGLAQVSGEKPLLNGANPTNWQAVAELAKKYGCPLVARADSLESLAELTEQIRGAGVEDIVLDPGTKQMRTSLLHNTHIRRLAIKKNFRSLGFPTIAYVTNPAQAAQAVAKYTGFIVVDAGSLMAEPDFLYPLVVLRQNIYTDPQKPIQVQPGLYEINNPGPDSMVLVTTNFSITYFSVANEVEGSGLPAWLLVADAEGMSVLTAWAAGKFDAERIAKAIKTFNVADKVTRKRVVLPGHVAVLSGELEGEIPDWEIRVGPREAVDLPAFMKMAA
jgi:acetyl-CoA decarbonylase/synthase complex subunit gamma